MEHISKVLAELPCNIPTQRNSGTKLNSRNSEPEEETEETAEDKLRRFNISSFDHTFENFRRAKGTPEALNIFRNLAGGKSDRKFILCFGIEGSGKTHLIEATIIAWAQQGIFARYNTMSEIIRRLKSSFNQRSILPYEQVFKSICDTPNLIIDDYGMGSTETRWEVSELEDIINERYHKRYYDDGKITILASNKDIKDLPRRVVSRFYDPEFGVVVFMKAGDYRRRKL